MTTESQHHPRTGMSPLLGALAAGAAAVVSIVAVAAVVDGRAGAVGAVAGGGLTLAVFALGTSLVGLVARVLPSASLMVALLTYVLQLLVLALVIVALDGADLDPATFSRGWFAAGVIAVTLLWMAGQLVAATRQRIPAFDDPAAASTGVEPVPHPGGER